MKRSFNLAVIAMKTSNTKRLFFFFKVHFTHTGVAKKKKTSDRKQYDRIKIAESRSRKRDKKAEEDEEEGRRILGRESKGES